MRVCARDFSAGLVAQVGGVDGAEAVDVEAEVVLDGAAQRIKDEIDAFPSCQFCSGDKVTVSGDEDDAVDLLFVGQRADVQTDADVRSFLLEVEAEVHFLEVVHGALAG